MANLRKYTKAACGHILQHFDRSAENISNENLDRARSHLNYNLAANIQPLKQIEFLRKRCGEVQCLKREDVKVLATWVITAPKDLPPAEHKEFFAECYEFLKDRYGARNVVSAWVHMDEVTPHLHFAFVPVVRGLKKDRGGAHREIEKVSTKELLTRAHMFDFHPALRAHLTRAMGHEVSVMNGRTAREGNKDIKTFKREFAEMRLKGEKTPSTAQEPLRAPQVEAVPSRATEAKLEPLTRKRENPPRGYIDMSDEAVIERIRKSKRGGEFEQLWRGEELTGDREIDEFKLLNLLSWFCDQNREQMQRIFKHSGLYRPELGQEYLDRATDTTLKGYESPSQSAGAFRSKSRDRDNGNYK